MVIINNVRFSVDEDDLKRSSVIVRLTFPSVGKSLITFAKGSLLERLKHFTDESSLGRLVRTSPSTALAIEESAYINVEILKDCGVDLVQDPQERHKALMKAYNLMYGYIGSERTYKPYGFNDLRLDPTLHEGGQRAIGAVMRLRAKLRLHRVRESTGEYIFVKVNGHNRGKKPRNNFRILQYDLSYNFIKAWDTYKEIADEYGFDRRKLNAKAVILRDTADGEPDNILGGYRWFVDYSADWAEGKVVDGKITDYYGGYGDDTCVDHSRDARKRVVSRRGTIPVVKAESDDLYIMGGLL